MNKTLTLSKCESQSLTQKRSSHSLSLSTTLTTSHTHHTDNETNDAIAPHFFAKNYKCYERDPKRVKWSKIMYILKRTVDTAPSDKWHPSPKLSAFSRTISEPILYSIAVPKRCTFRRVTPAHHISITHNKPTTQVPYHSQHL